eukprot:scaffold27128_cov30-Prasinocladus_malaysianus.AAC.2
MEAGGTIVMRGNVSLVGTNYAKNSYRIFFQYVPPSYGECIDIHNVVANPHREQHEAKSQLLPANDKPAMHLVCKRELVRHHTPPGSRQVGSLTSVGACRQLMGCAANYNAISK